jgi:polar amino acid transport system permease protein
MTFDWEYLYEVLPILLEASGVTVLATALGMLVAMVLGLLFALLRNANIAVLSRGVSWFIEFVRVTPLLVQLFFVFYVLPLYGLTLPAMATGIIVIGVHYSAYTSEVYRAGFAAVGQEQWDAISSLNIGPVRALYAIVVPQAMIPMIPSFGNYFIELLKNTSLLSAITIPELVSVGKTISFFNFKYLEVFTAIGLIYLLLSYSAAVLVRQLEIKMRIP